MIASNFNFGDADRLKSLLASIRQTAEQHRQGAAAIPDVPARYRPVCEAAAWLAHAGEPVTIRALARRVAGDNLGRPPTDFVRRAIEALRAAGQWRWPLAAEAAERTVSS